MSYYIQPERGVEYQKWLNSAEAWKLAGRILKETGFKYLNSYCPILGFGEYDCEDWWVGPDWAAFDKICGSKASNEWVMKTWNFLDQTRPSRSRLMRTARDVRIMAPRAKKK